MCPNWSWSAAVISLGLPETFSKSSNSSFPLGTVLHELLQHKSSPQADWSSVGPSVECCPSSQGHRSDSKLTPVWCSLHGLHFRTKYCGGKLLLMLLIVAPHAWHLAVTASKVGAPEAAWWGVSAGLEPFQYRISPTYVSHKLLMKTSRLFKHGASSSFQENNRKLRTF